MLVSPRHSRNCRRTHSVTLWTLLAASWLCCECLWESFWSWSRLRYRDSGSLMWTDSFWKDCHSAVALGGCPPPTHSHPIVPLATKAHTRQELLIYQWRELVKEASHIEEILQWKSNSPPSKRWNYLLNAVLEKKKKLSMRSARGLPPAPFCSPVIGAQTSERPPQLYEETHWPHSPRATWWAASSIDANICGR